MGLTAKEQAQNAAAAFVWVAIFPGRERRRSARNIFTWAIVQALLSFSVRQWLVPWSERLEAERERLTAELGREPTPDELMERLRA